MTDPTDPDLVFDLDAVRVAAASTPEPGGAMLTSMADLLESIRERYRMAEVIADIARMKIRADDTPVPLKDGDKMPMILSWVCRTLAGCLEAKGAPNYFGWGWTDNETGKSYRIRVQHEGGKSPEQVAAEARDERDAALERVRSMEDRAADRDAVTAAALTERDELLATIANERGEGEGPSEGWRVSRLLASQWNYQSGSAVLASVTAPGIADDDRRWTWRTWRAGMEHGAAPTAREAMRAAELSLGVK